MSVPQPKLAYDANGTAIQAVELADSVTDVSVGLTSSNAAIPSGAKLVRIALGVDSFIRFGTAGVSVSTSNGHYFPKGVEVLVVPRNNTHLATISADGSTTGIGSISSVAATYDI